MRYPGWVGATTDGVFHPQMRHGQFVREARDTGEWLEIDQQEVVLGFGPWQQEVVGVAYALPHNAFAKYVS